MGPRASVAVGIAAGLVIAALCGAVLVSLASGGAATITLAPSAAVTPAPSAAAPQPVPSPATPGAAASPATSPSSGVSIGDPGPVGGSPVAGSPGVSTAPASSGASGPGASATTGASVPPSRAPVTPPPSPVTGSLFGVGKPAPPLVVERLDGGSIDLASLRGRPVWVAFTGTYCPPCRDEYPTMESFALRYAATGLVVVAVHVKDDPAAVASLVGDLGITFPVGLDPDGTAARDWRAIALPIHFWIDRDGIVRSGALGGVGPDAMAAGLATILPGVPVTP